MRYSITLCYDGSSFFGWQTQPGVPTVQGTLEDALGKLLRAPVSVTGAGRTDTAVNAAVRRITVTRIRLKTLLCIPPITRFLTRLMSKSLSYESFSFLTFHQPSIRTGIYRTCFKNLCCPAVCREGYVMVFYLQVRVLFCNILPWKSTLNPVRQQVYSESKAPCTPKGVHF